MNRHQAKFTIETVSDPENLAVIAALARRIWQAHYPGMISQDQIDYMLKRGYSIERLKKDIDVLGVTYWLAFRKSDAVGFAAVGPDEQDAGFWLHKLYVDASQRRRGLAERFVALAVDKARTQGENELWLRVNRENALALAAYTRLGFKKSRCDVKDIGSGFVMDDYLLCRTLPT